MVMRRLPLIGILWLAAPTAAWALPEAARYNHFTCTSCHVNPAGQGTLTSYGRDFSAAKLSTWRYENEENLLHGLVPLSDRFLVGGDVRYVDLRRKTGDQKFEKFFRMQTDLEAGVHFGPVWATYAVGTTPSGPTTPKEEAEEVKTRSFAARVDLWDQHVILRAGLFMPKFGLMLSDHTAFVRIASGLNPDGEQTQAEATYQDDRLEVTAAALVESEAFDRKGKTKSGYGLGVSTFLRRSRFNLNLLSTTLPVEGADVKTTAVSTSAVVTATPRIYGMAEIARVMNTIATEVADLTSNALANYFSVHYEAYKGLIPFLRYEFWDTDIVPPNTSTQRWGGGVTWYPRPHLQVEARYLRGIANQTITTSDQSDVVLHYYF
jgi:hypothetical protein